jgi:hypothetical protein
LESTPSASDNPRGVGTSWHGRAGKFIRKPVSVLLTVSGPLTEWKPQHGDPVPGVALLPRRWQSGVTAKRDFCDRREPTQTIVFAVAHQKSCLTQVCSPLKSAWSTASSGNVSINITARRVTGKRAGSERIKMKISHNASDLVLHMIIRQKYNNSRAPTM